MASREREYIYIYIYNEEKRIYLHGCFDSFGMLRFASRVKESSSSSSRCVAQMFYSTPKKEEKNTHFLQGNVFRVLLRNPK